VRAAVLWATLAWPQGTSPLHEAPQAGRWLYVHAAVLDRYTRGPADDRTLFINFDCVVTKA
jgi:hypothetical protein